MIGLLSWLLTGLVVGVAGRLLLPGSPTGWATSIGVALLGAGLGGVAATLLEMGGTAELDPRGLVLAFLMAALLVILTQLLRVVRSDPER